MTTKYVIEKQIMRRRMKACASNPPSLRSNEFKVWLSIDDEFFCKESSETHYKPKEGKSDG
jgi:hypothetical protein